MANNRFDYVKYDAESEAQQKAFKDMFAHLASQVEMFKPGRAQALVLTKLEESYMWVGKMIRDQQISRTPETPLNEVREQAQLELAKPPESQL